MRLWRVLLVLLFCSGFAQTVSATLPDAAELQPPQHTVQVGIGVYVLSVNRVADASDPFPSYDAEVFLDLRWRDPRLAWGDGKGAEPRVLTEHNAETLLNEIWHPAIELENAERARTREHLKLIVRSDGAVEYEERFNAVLKTRFDLIRFPFDRQTLEMDIESSSWTRDELVFKVLPSHTGFNPDMVAPEWRFLDHSTELRGEREIRAEDEFHELIFRLSVERDPGFYLWKLILPLFVIVALSWSVFWMTGEQSSGRMMRAFLALLAVVASHRVISGYLPRITEITFLDAVVYAAYFFTALTIIENVLVHRAAARGAADVAEKIDRRSQLWVPSGFIVLCVVLWFGYH
ncbi:MAG: hypothetical protein H6981_14940 [Gammaproteobacteria bacterium]|nr:hypothetical protein [Gammaproteobacteria bacterium]MCP5138081.1 hypothetical protein [Gammaproteobacteria bacterium]